MDLNDFGLTSLQNLQTLSLSSASVDLGGLDLTPLQNLQRLSLDKVTWGRVIGLNKLEELQDLTFIGRPEVIRGIKSIPISVTRLVIGDQSIAQ